MTSPLRWARRTVVAVFLLGLVVVVGPAVWHARSLFRDPFTGAQERRTVETFGADGTLTGREVTTSPSGGSLVERSLAAGGVLLLRLAVVSAAAYLAGALVYRTMSGTFPSEIGGVKFAEDAAVGLEKAGANLEAVRKEVAELAGRMDAAALEVNTMRAAASEGAASVADLHEQLDATRDTVRQLGQTVLELAQDLRKLGGRRPQ
jgi:hypothetical protein